MLVSTVIHLEGVRGTPCWSLVNHLEAIRGTTCWSLVNHQEAVRGTTCRPLVNHLDLEGVTVSSCSSPSPEAYKQTVMDASWFNHVFSPAQCVARIQNWYGGGGGGGGGGGAPPPPQTPPPPLHNKYLTRVKKFFLSRREEQNLVFAWGGFCRYGGPRGTSLRGTVNKTAQRARGRHF